VRQRKSARLVVLNARDEVLLFHNIKDASHTSAYWVTPGGGLEPGERWEAAALRELWEETTIAGVLLGPCLWTRRKAGLMFGEHMLSLERYYLVRVGDVAVSTANQLAHERVAYQAHRWWSLADLRVTGEVVFPVGLADLIAPVLQGVIPDSPIAIPAD